MKITCKEFQDLIENNKIMVGDLVCVKNGESGWIGKTIEHIQYKLLLDLDINKDLAKEFSTFTHTAIIVNPTMVAEMYRPKGRFRNFNDLLPTGTQIIIKRPIHLDQHHTIESRGDLIANAALGYIRKEPDYPFSELFCYYFWSWDFNKLFLGRKVINIFKNTKYNVCSGFCWEMYLMNESIDINELNEEDIYSEAWYPARLTMDNKYFQNIGVFDIVNS